MGTLKTTNIQTITGSGTLTIGQSGETVSLGSGVSGGTLSNYPAFGFNFSGDNLPSAQNTSTKIPSANITMIYNVGNAFDTSNSRFTVPSGYAGKYFFYFKFLGNNNSNVYRGDFFKNGSILYDTTNGVTGQARTSEGDNSYTPADNTLFIDLAVGDYIEFYIKNSSSSTTIFASGQKGFNYAMGYRLIGI